MKKLLSVFLVACLCCGLVAGCGAQEESERPEEKAQRVREELQEMEPESSYGEDRICWGNGRYQFQNIVFDVPDGVVLNDFGTAIGDYFLFNYDDGRVINVRGTDDYPLNSDDAVRKSIEDWSVEANLSDKEFEIIEAKALQIAGTDAMVKEYKHSSQWVREITLLSEAKDSGIQFASSAADSRSEEADWNVLNEIVGSIVVL